ncbi:MAG: hypothetical protein FJ224_00550 [Lentisphaerae bacterium]|nr:hypothetical protein [Lentisphaerota bacterium]
MPLGGLDLRRLDPECALSLRSMAGKIAHDMNNMLVPLAAYPELLRCFVEGQDEATGYIDSMEKALDGITCFMRRLLALSGRDRGERVVHDMNDMAVAAASVVSEVCPGIAVECSRGGETAAILCDIESLDMAVREICSNAFEAMPSGGKLRISTGLKSESGGRTSTCGLLVPAGEYAWLRVQDSGHGMSEGEMSSLFCPLESAKHRGGRRGAGMGLSLVWVTVRDHGGHIDVSSGKEGTTVSVSLPTMREGV